MKLSGVSVSVLGKHLSGKESCILEVLQGEFFLVLLLFKLAGSFSLLNTLRNVRTSLCTSLRMMIV